VLFRDLVYASPVVPAIRDPALIPASIAAPSRVVYLLCGAITTIGTMVAQLRDGGKAAVANIDLLSGITGDSSAVQFLESCGVTGIISTHPETLRATRARNLLAIQRSFLLDSQALSNSMRALERFVPDAMELLPAPAAPYAAPKIAHAHPDLPLVAGGLITSLGEIDALVRTGILAVSVSDPRLWVV
jgi:glycerol uptake operon antiterminator